MCVMERKVVLLAESGGNEFVAKVKKKGVTTGNVAVLTKSVPTLNRDSMVTA